MDTSTIIVILVVLNLVLLALGVVAWRLFRSDPNPTVSDPLGVPRVARVSGIVGTLSDGSGSTGRSGKSVVAAAAQAAPVPASSAPAPSATQSAPAAIAHFGSVPVPAPGLTSTIACRSRVP